MAKVKVLFCYLIVLLSLSVLRAVAAPYGIKDVPNVQLMDNTLFVSDPEDYISSDEEQRLNQLIAEIRRTTAVQIAVVILPSVDADLYADAQAFAHELFNSWGIGDKETNKGLLIVNLVEQRDIAFETGYGLEGMLPDGLCKLVQTRYMVPLLREEAYGEALYAGVEEIAKILNGESNLPELYQDVQRQEEQEMHSTILIFFAIWLGCGMLYLLYQLFQIFSLKGKGGWYSYMKIKELKEHSLWITGIFFLPLLPILGILLVFFGKDLLPKITCPHCHAQGTMVRQGKATRLNTSSSDDNQQWQAAYSCTKCRSVETIKYAYAPFTLGTFFRIIFFILSLFFRGGSGGGGGRSGGSWGGGSSGGGGAHTRY